ncbi:MAG: SMC-Scp complex subunit ScpB [Phycisphaerae bacterium]
MPEAVDEPERSGDAPAEIHPHRVVEAILLSTDTPLAPAKIATILGIGNARDVRKHIENLNAQYAEQGLSFRVEHIAGGYQILTLPEYNTWISKLQRVRQETKLSAAAMETLAIVAYKQPCTRADIEAVRGVAAGDMLNRLREMNVVKIVGRAEDLGRPLLYGTTKRFLEVFGLPSLDDLPRVEALRSGGEASKTEESQPADVSETPSETDDDVSDETATPVDEPADDTGECPTLSLVDEEDEALSEDGPEP